MSAPGKVLRYPDRDFQRGIDERVASALLECVVSDLKRLVTLTAVSDHTRRLALLAMDPVQEARRLVEAGQL